ncbi:MAG: sulfurtransferase TusA family protein [Anaerolineae bacterium]
MISSVTAPSQVLDCTGLNCPLPVVKTAGAIKKIEVGEILEVRATDPASPADLAAWAKNTGHEIVGQWEANGVYTFHVRRSW